MAVIKKNAIVPYSAEQMYKLVNRVEEYPEFLPYCVESAVLSADEDQMRASLTLAWKGISRSFVTCNRLQKNKMIEVRLEEGPLHHLEGFWRFDPIGENGCSVMLDLEFEIAGNFFSMIFGPVFHQMANTLVDAFVARARDVYGTAVTD